MKDNAVWIWKEKEQLPGKQMVLFCRLFELAAVPQKYFIGVSADTRYILYVNGEIAGRGPCKSTADKKYYESYDIAPLVREGENVIYARVSYQPSSVFDSQRFLTGSTSMLSSDRAGFILWEEDMVCGIDTDSRWQCAADAGYNYVLSTYGRYAGDVESVDLRKKPNGFMLDARAGEQWHSAAEISDTAFTTIYGELNNWVLAPSPIKPLYEENRRFKSVMRGPDILRALNNGSEFIVEPNSEICAELDFGEYTTAYPKLRISGGRDSLIELVYAECYILGEEKGILLKKFRDDCENGFLIGDSDRFTAADGEQLIEPYFFRSFRFIKLIIKTKSEPLVLKDICAGVTGYPVCIQGSFESDLSQEEQCFKIGIHTLECCMHETYEDCPYYEQMQYVFDTMLQMLFTFQVCGDKALAKKALYDFMATQRPDGLITSTSPTRKPQLIPGFALFFIMAVRYYYLYTADGELLKDALPVIERILRFFEKKLCRETGLLRDVGAWEFVDWVPAWQENKGSCMSRGENYEHYNYIYSMMYAVGCEDFARLCGELSRCETAAEYKERAAALRKGIKVYAYDRKSGYYRHKKGGDDFSLHAQIWAVLCGAESGENAGVLIAKAVNDSSLHPVSYCYTFWLMRALEKAGVYGLSNTVWDKWNSLLKLNITTWPERPVNGRSECHAWSSIHLYEYPAMVLGVRPAKPGYEELQLRPRLYGRKFAKGSVMTAKGRVDVQLARAKEYFNVKAHFPEIMNITLIWPDGKRQKLYTDILDEKFLIPDGIEI